MKRVKTIVKPRIMKPQTKRARPELYIYQVVDRTVKTDKPKTVLSVRIREYCAMHNITYTMLNRACTVCAAAYGISFSESLINLYANGYFSPKIDRLTIIAKVMGVSISWLTGYDDKT